MDALAASDLAQARQHHARRAWALAFAAFRAADCASALDADDLERYATAAYLVGRDDDYLDALERAHHAHLNQGRRLQGVRCAFWLGLRLLLRGEGARANGWFARAERLADAENAACAERGYLLVPAAEQAFRAGALDKAESMAAAIARIAEQFADTDLLTCAQHVQGRVLLRRGDVARGLAQLDEIMLAVTAQSLSPILTGLMYCSVIGECQEICAASRAWEWTFALTRWCEQQPEMVAFTTACLVHRAEVLRLHGDWREALCEAERAASRPGSPAATATAFYEMAEIHRLRGHSAEAEDAYRGASRYGHEAQPGLALLRLAQGRTRIAAAAIRRVAGTASAPLERVKILPAYVEIMLAIGDLAAARSAADELESVALRFDTELVAATAAQARGEVELAEGDAYAALGSLRRALTFWQALHAPYLAARARVAIALACRALGDEDGAALELELARAALERLEAAPDLAHLDALRARPPAGVCGAEHGLTPRELQVLRLVTTGRTNRQIAAELALSEKTVHRHMSNIFAKLEVPSRAAATAFAFRHRLV